MGIFDGMKELRLKNRRNRQAKKVYYKKGRKR